MPQGVTMGLPVAVREAREALLRTVGRSLLETRSLLRKSTFTTTQPCAGCGKTPRVRWPRHPNLCRDCVTAHRWGIPEDASPAPTPEFGAQEPDGAPSQATQPAILSKQVIRRRRRQLVMVTVEEARQRASALYGTYKSA